MHLKKKISSQIYPVDYCFIYSDETLTIKENYNLSDEIVEGINQCHAIITGIDKSFKRETVIIFFNKKKELKHGYISHECFHAANYTMQFIGWEFDPENDEPIAYLLTWLVDECYKFLNSQKIII